MVNQNWFKTLKMQQVSKSRYGARLVAGDLRPR